jgi:Calx-beta domain-containing protein
LLRRRVTVAVLAAALMLPISALHATSASAVVTGPPRVLISSNSSVEGQMTRRYLRFTVDLSWPSTSTVTVQYATSDITGTAGPDYVAKSGTLTFLPGQQVKFIPVLTWADRIVEGDETFNVTLSNPTNATLGNATGTGTIIDDDPNVGPRVSVGDAMVSEVCAGKKASAAVVVTMSIIQSSPVTVHVATSDGTAAAGSDYTAVSKTLTYTNGQILKEIKIPIWPDLLTEGDESFTVTVTVVSGPTNVQTSKATGTVTILDCVPPS